MQTNHCVYEHERIKENNKKNETKIRKRDKRRRDRETERERGRRGRVRNKKDNIERECDVMRVTC